MVLVASKCIEVTNKYRSRFEANFAKTLRSKKVKWEYESEWLEYTLHKKYNPDFIVTTRSGKKLYLETKGKLTVTDRAKMRAVKEAHPDKDIRMVFMAPNNKLYKGAKTTYAEWADNHGFPWCRGPKIPKEWLR